MNRLVPGWLTLCLLLASPLVAAQEAADDPPPVNTEDVDREEAEFRRRMELEESQDDGRSVVPPTSPDIIDVQPAPGPLDHLPPESREHLEDALTELIIQNGRWEPTDADVTAPYTPSEAAQADPELAAEEQVAWEEMVGAYHERERAAYAGTGGGAGQGSGSGSGSGSGPGGAGGSAGDGGGAGPGAATASRPPDERAAREPQDEAFNALEFLREQGEPGVPEPAAPEPPGPSGGSSGTADGAGASTPAAQQPPASGGDPGADSHQQPESDTDQGPGEDRQSTEERDEEPGQEDPGQAEPEPREADDGSVPADALDALFRANPPSDQGEMTDASGDTAAQAPPGSQVPGDDQDDSQDSAEVPSEPNSASTPPTSTPPPPETGFFAWLRRLFSGDEDQDKGN